MQPIGSQSPPDALGKVTDDVKLVILKCLGISDLNNAKVINKLWQNIVHKPLVWQQIAKQFNIQLVNPKNAELEVLDYLRYHDIYEVFKSHVLEKPSFEEFLKGSTLDSQRYGAVLNYLASEHCKEYHPFLGFLRQLSQNRTEIGEKAAKQMIQDGVLNEDSLLKAGLKLALGGTGMTYPYGVDKANLEIFSALVTKIKESPAASEILYQTLQDVLSFGSNVKPFIEVLLKAGAKPTEDSISEAFKNGTDELILDYCDEIVRKKALDEIENEAKYQLDIEDGEFSKPDYMNKSQLTKFATQLKTILQAPPPTYGKKSGQDTGNPVKK